MVIIILATFHLVILWSNLSASISSFRYSHDNLWPLIPKIMSVVIANRIGMTRRPASDRSPETKATAKGQYTPLKIPQRPDKRNPPQHHLPKQVGTDDVIMYPLIETANIVN